MTKAVDCGAVVAATFLLTIVNLIVKGEGKRIERLFDRLGVLWTFFLTVMFVYYNVI